MWVNRTWCDCLRGIRDCSKTMNFGPVGSLVEELQVYGDRMESALADNKDLLELNIKLSEAKASLKKLELKIKRKKLELKALNRKKK